VSGKRRDLTTDEKKLWRRVAAGVKTKRALPPETEAGEIREPPKKSAPGFGCAAAAASQIQSANKLITPESRKRKARAARQA
jgi:hypothetical protein